MKFFRIYALLALVAILLTSCDGKSPLVKRSALEQSESEKAELQNSLKNLQDSYAKQNEDLCDILNELSSVSRKTTQIQLNVEGGAAQMDQVELIHSDIDAIKLRIDELEKEANRARKLDKKLAIATKTINELRETISIQESRIAELNEAISRKDVTIQTQQNTISTQSDKIASQEEELRRTIAKQVEMLYQAGASFEDIADNGDFKITGRKNKSSIREYRKSIYETAAAYYEMAAYQGYAQAQTDLDGVRAKIAAL